MHLSTHQTLQGCHDKLMAKLAGKQDELRRRETSQGNMHDPVKMNRLRKDIASIEARLRSVERMML